MIRFLEHRIGDRRIIRLIQKWLRAGVLEEGQKIESIEGTPQGAVISPLLANIYLHYVFDLWAEQWRRRHATGDMIIVRYADDSITGFQYRRDADRFLNDLRNRLASFSLSLHPDKTRLIEFGRFAADSRRKRDEENRKRSISWGSRTTVTVPGRMGPLPSGGRRSGRACSPSSGRSRMISARA
jgi:RNA-directed DNA polymerase